jgi:hypothetical protein
MKLNKLIILTLTILYLSGCSSNKPDLGGGSNADNQKPRAEVLNKQAKADHLPEWLRTNNGEQRCADTQSTYCGLECADVQGKNYSLNERYASNLARARVVGYLGTGIKAADDALRGENSSLSVRTHINHTSAVVDRYAYGITIFDTAYRDSGEGLQVCSLAVFRPQLATEMMSAYSRVAKLDYDNQMQQKIVQKILEKEFRDRVTSLYRENEEKQASSNNQGAGNE